MKTHLKIIASEMLVLAADEFSNHTCNDLEPDLIRKIKPYEKEICDAVRKSNGNSDDWPESLEVIGDSALMSYASKAIAGYTACQEEDRWVPVKKYLPESSDSGLSEPMLTIDQYGRQQVCQYCHNKNAWAGALEYSKITHFQKLPNPPKK